MYVTYGEQVNLTFNQLELAESLVKVLKIFDLATAEESSDKAIIAHILPITANLLKKINQFVYSNNNIDLYGIEAMLQDLKMQFKRHFSKPMPPSISVK